MSSENNNLRLPVAPLKIAALESCRELAEKVNAHLVRMRSEDSETAGDRAQSLHYRGYDADNFLLDIHCSRFGTGEGKGSINESVRGSDLYVMVDVTNYSLTYKVDGNTNHMSPDDHFQDLKRIIAAIGGKAKRITVIMPMLYESRQHRRTSRESLDCAMALHELNNMGVDNILTFDAHDPRVANSIPLGGFESIMPTYQMMKALLKNVKDLTLDKDHLMFVSPDEGAMQRNIYYASVLSLDLGMSYKRRDYSTIVNGRNPIVAHEYLGASVEGKDVIVVDDMISSGESVIELAKELKARGAARIMAMATFGFFTNGIEEFNRAYEEGLIYRVINTNGAYLQPELKAAPWHITADISKYISYLIATLNHDRSIHELLSPLKRIQKLVTNYREEQTRNGIRLV